MRGSRSLGATQKCSRPVRFGRIAEGSRLRLGAAAPSGATGSVNGLVDVLQGALLLRRDNAAAGATSDRCVEANSDTTDDEIDPSTRRLVVCPWGD